VNLDSDQSQGQNRLMPSDRVRKLLAEAA